MLQTFRPAQTVFETGIGTGSLGTNKVNGGALPQQMSLKNKLIKGTEMMKALRDANFSSLERNRVVVAAQQAALRAQGIGPELAANRAAAEEEEEEGSVEGSDAEDDREEEGSEDSEEEEDSDAEDSEQDDNSDEEEEEVDEYDLDDDMSFTTARTGPTLGGSARRQSAASALREAQGQQQTGQMIDRTAVPAKVRMSITEKKKLKKKGLSQEEIRDVALKKAAAEKALQRSGTVISNPDSRNTSSVAGSGMSAGLNDTYKDRKHYMAYGDEDATQSFAEESMQPQSNLRNSESMSK